jgi:hypothetical protein
MIRHANPFHRGPQARRGLATPPAEQLTVAEQVARREEEQREKALACVGRNADLFRSNISHQYIIEQMPELGRLSVHEADDLVYRRMTSPTSPWVPELGHAEEEEAVARPAPNAGSSPRGDRTPRPPFQPGEPGYGGGDPFAQAADQIRYDRM